MDGDKLDGKLPSCDLTNPAELEAWFGPFGNWDHWRKSVLANCREMIRAANATGGNVKLTESRLDDLARTHDAYLSFLLEGLKGRTLREQNVRDSLGQR